MQFKKLFATQKKKRIAGTDIYQDSVNRVGKEQFKKLLEKGLNVPIVLL